MSCAKTNLPECMTRNRLGKIPVSQKIHVQIGDTPKHAVLSSVTMSYLTDLAKLPDTADFFYIKMTLKEMLSPSKIMLALPVLGMFVLYMWQPISDYFLTGSYDDNVIVCWSLKR